VNTASRMESTGVPNHIQVSESTADSLARADKGHWLQLRDKKVEVKGKGLMQTYWAEPTPFSPVPTTKVIDRESAVNGEGEELVMPRMNN
jgi:class 3 adenylate cyclase